MKTVSIQFTLNGRQVFHETPANQMLVDLIRRQERLLGTKLSCDQAVCGACTILINKSPRAACATFAFEADGQEVLTIEGLAEGDVLSAVQEAFIDNSAFQCGYCTPGMIMLATALLEQDPKPSEAAIRQWMGANICRCTGYQMIVEAVQSASRANP